MSGVLSLGVKAGSLIKFTPPQGSTDIPLLRVITVLDNGLRVKFEFDGQRYIVSDAERIELRPELFVSCGISPWNNWPLPSKSKLAFEAPTSLLINRLDTAKIAA
jgi:hypothetical protein